MPAAFTWRDVPSLVPRLIALLPDALYKVEELPLARIRDRRTGEIVGLVWPRRDPNNEDAPCLVFEVKGCVNLNEPPMEADTIEQAAREIRRTVEHLEGEGNNL